MKKQKTWTPGGKKAEAAPKQEILPPDENVPVPHGGGGPTDAGWHKVESALYCLKEYQFSQIRGIKQPAGNMPDYFATGIGVHAGRARWFADRFPSDKKGWERVEAAVDEEFEKQKLPVSLPARNDTLKFLKEYCEHWSLQPKPTPVVAEHLIGPAPLQPGDPFPLWRTARVDDASYYPEALGGLCVGELKTTSTSINDCINQYTLHGQPTLQFVLWKMATQGEAQYGKLKGIMLDVVKKGYGRDKSQFARHLVTFSDHMLAWYVRNMQVMLRVTANIEWNTEVPRNINSCTRLIGRQRVACQFRDLCAHGKTASIKYVLPNGKSLLSWRPSAEATVPPWE